MKNFILSLSILFTGSCGAQSMPVEKNGLRLVSWLAGTWERTGLPPQKKGSENWKISNEHEMKGIGLTMQGRDTLEMEKLLIVLRNDTVYYVADVKENRSPVYFAFTQLSSTGFVCENPSHDFPKKITYRRQKDRLVATISGDDKSISYSYRRKN